MMVVIPFIKVQRTASEEFSHALKSFLAFCLLRNHKLWKYLPFQSKTRFGMCEETYSKASFTINKSQDPSNVCKSLLLIVCTRRFVTFHGDKVLWNLNSILSE